MVASKWVGDLVFPRTDRGRDMMRRFGTGLWIVFGLLFASLTVVPAGSATLDHQVADYAALDAGRPGMRAVATLSIDPDEAFDFEDELAWSLAIDDVILVSELVDFDRGRMIVHLFAEIPVWPTDPEQSSRAATLLYEDKPVAAVQLTGPSNGVGFSPGAQPTPADIPNTLAVIFEPGYLAATSKNQQRWFSELGGDGNWLDLGHMAFRRNAFAEAAYFYARAADEDRDDALAVAWLGKSIAKGSPFDVNMLLAVEPELKRRVALLQESGARQAEGFEAIQQSVRVRTDALRQEFSTTQEALNALVDRSEDNEEAQRLAARLTAINVEIGAANEELQLALSEIERPTPFIIAGLFEMQSALSRLAAGRDEGPGGLSEREWIEAAQFTSELAYEQDFNPAGLDRTLRSRALMRKAAIADREAKTAKAALEANPALESRDRLQAEHDRQIEALDIKREQTEAAAQTITERPELKALELESDKLREAFEVEQSAYNESVNSLDAEQSALQEARNALGDNPSEDAREDFNAKVDAFNRKIEAVNAGAAPVQEKADAANAAAAAYTDAVNRALDDNNAEYNALVEAANATLNQIKAANAALAENEPKYKDLIFERDQNLALARDELYRLMSDTPTREGDDLLSAADSVVFVPDGAERLYTARPWCRAINFRCERCVGLAVLGCTFAELDAGSACENGERISFSLPATGSGGIIGACRGVRALALGEKRWTVPSTRRKPLHSTAIETDDTEGLSDAVSDTLGGFFDPDASCGAPPSTGDSTDGDSAEGDSDGLSAYLDAFEKNLAAERQRRQEEAEKRWRMAEMERRLALVKQNSALADDPEIAELIEKFEAMPGLLSEPANAELFADKLAERAVHAIQTDIAASGNQAEWEQKARRINEMAKEANEIASELGYESESLKKLTGYVDNAASILDGARDGNADKVRSGIQGFVGAVPGPVGSLLNTPQGYALAGTVQYTNDITRGSTDVLKEFNSVLDGSDPDAERRMVEKAEALQKKLTPKAYIKTVFIDPTRAYVENELPGGKTIIKVFDWLNSDSDSGSCQPPAPPIPDFD